MDRAIEIIKEFIQEYGAIRPSVGDIDMEAVFDDERGHYLLMMQGWNRDRRIHSVIVHVDVSSDKIYVQHEGTLGIMPFTR